MKKLLLGEFPLTSESLSTIGILPNLEEPTLLDSIILGEELKMKEDDTFDNLKFLKLSGATLAKWEVGEECFPVLEKLHLWVCHKLKEIPPSFGYCFFKNYQYLAEPST